MEFSTDNGARPADIAALFERSFAAAEGAEEGRAVGALAQALLETTPADDLLVATAHDDGVPVGCAIFSRLVFAGGDRTVFLLSPVAVAPDRQGRGIGGRLLTHALDALRARGVDVAVTYGDPRFYARVGFASVSTATVPAPHPLSRPEGWLAQSLTGRPLDPLPGPARCAAPLDDPAFW